MEPSTAGQSGASSAPSTGATSASPAATASVTPQTATSKKIDMGMGPQGSTQGTQPAAQSTQYDDKWWDQHGPAIFQHDRFKELSGYKDKFEQSKPVAEFAQQFGGFDALQEFARYLGPVWQGLVNSGDKTGQVWAKLLPVLQAVAAGQPIDPFFQAQQQQAQAMEAASDEGDPFAEKIAPLQEKLSTLENRERDREMRALVEKRNGNLEKYNAMFESMLKAEVRNLPEDLKNDLGAIVVQHIHNYMPKGQDGKPIHALDMVSKEALEAVFEKHIDPLLRKLEGWSLEKAKKVTSSGGPTLPNVHANGKAPGGPVTPASREDKAMRFAQGMKNLM